MQAMQANSMRVIYSGADVLPQALTELKSQLADAQPAFALVLASLNYPAQELAAGLKALLATTPWIGMTVMGLIVGHELCKQGIALALFEGPMRAGVSGELPVGLPAAMAGQMAVRQASDRLGGSIGPNASLIMLCSPLAGPIDEILRGALYEAGSGPTWIGGGSGGPHQSGVLLANGQVLNQAVAFAVLSPPGQSALSQGWTPLGGSAVVTRSQQTVIQALNYAPAFEVYTRLAEIDGFRCDPGQFVKFASRHPFGVSLVSGHYLIRSALQLDAKGALHCAAEIPENCLIQLMSGHPASLIAATAQAAEELQSRGPYAGLLAFSGHARHEALGLRSVEERDACQRAFGTTPCVGCVCLGQIASVSGGVPHFHNQSLALLGLSP